MLCGVVVLSNCACIWISFSSRLLAETFAAPATEELSDEAVPFAEPDDVAPLVPLGAEVIEMLDASV